MWRGHSHGPMRGSGQVHKAVKVPSSVTFVTEEQFICIMGTLTYLALYVIQVQGNVVGVMQGWWGSRR